MLQHRGLAWHVRPYSAICSDVSTESLCQQGLWRMRINSSTIRTPDTRQKTMARMIDLLPTLGLFHWVRMGQSCQLLSQTAPVDPLASRPAAGLSIPWAASTWPGPTPHTWLARSSPAQRGRSHCPHSAGALGGPGTAPPGPCSRHLCSGSGWRAPG